MGEWAGDVVERVRSAFEPHRDEARALAMSAYMRSLFPFLGIATTERRALTREAMAGVRAPTQAELTEAVDALWGMPEREYQYAGEELLVRHLGVCDASFLAVVERLIFTTSWWDTVDTLAARAVGGLVARYPQLLPVMDEWVMRENIWIVRAAILHQLRYKRRTDASRLFAYCLARAEDREFFIRKAIGWALREYSKTDGDAVREFVAEHGDVLSGLSKREALLWLEGGRRARENAGQSEVPSG